MWQQQREKFTERKDRWMEVTGYILNRGNRDWSVNMSDFSQQWAKWRFDARKEIEAGEEWWLEQDKAMREEMGKWNEEASKAGSKAAVERMYQDLEARVSGYEKNIRSSIPSGGNFNIDTDAILKNALSNMPEMSLGVLNNSMSAVDTTAGLSNMLNLNLNGTLFVHNEKEMAAYEQAYSVMQNMRVLDILNAILDGFNEQLLYANESLYEAVETGMARAMPYLLAPFQRDKGAREWSIRVCVASNLTGDKYKTRRFTDYNSYENSTVFLKPIKGIGQEIDFTKPSSYINIDNEELEVYVGLAGEFLNREIDEVFHKGGFLSNHQDDEFARLGEQFGKYYGDWEAGEALKSAAFYSKPLFPNEPNMLQTVSIAASFTGQTWAAVLASTLTTGIQVADGSLSWKHAGVQMGVGMVTSMSGNFSPLVGMVGGGIKYEEGGGIGWSNKQFKEGVKSGVVKAGVQFLTNSTFATETIMSGIKTDGKWYKLGFDNSNWTQHLLTGLAAQISEGVTMATGNSTAGSFIQQGLMTVGYNISGGKGFKDDYSSINWGVFNSGAQQLGSMMGGMASRYLDTAANKYGAEQSKSRMPETPGDPLGAMENLLGGMWYGMRKLGESVSDMYSSVLETTGLGNAVDTVKGWGEKVNSWADTSRSIFGTADNVLSNIGVALGTGMMGAASWVKDAAVSVWDGVSGAVSTVVTAVQEGITDFFAPKVVTVPEVQAADWVQDVAYPIGHVDSDSQARADEKFSSYKKVKVIVNGKEMLINEEQKVDIKLLKQEEVGRKACYFTSVVMLAEALMGKVANLMDTFEMALNTKIPGINLNVTDSKGTVNSYEGVARAAGADVKDGSLISQDVTDLNKTISTMIAQLDNKNPVLIQLTGGHAEVVYGYEVKDNSLRFLVHDPGYQKDTYLDASNLQPYQGFQDYSTEKGGMRVSKYNEYRSVFRIKYFKR